MASTYLDLINKTLAKLREESVTTLPTFGDRTSNPRIAAVMDLVNEAMQEVLYDYTWKFTWKLGNQIWFYAPKEDTAATIANGLTLVTLGSGLSADDTNDITGEGRKSHLLVTNDANFSNTASRITTSSTAGPHLTLQEVWRGAGQSATATTKVFCNTISLGANTKSVIEVRDQERPLSLSFVDSPAPYNFSIPRPHDSFGPPTHATIASTGTLGFSSAWELSVWPIPDQDTILTLYTEPYSVVEPAGQLEMQAATDTLAGVSERVLNLIVQRAYIYALQSDIQNDPQRAQQLLLDWLRQIRMAVKQTKPMPFLHQTNEPFGRRGSGGGDPWQNWKTRNVSQI